MEKTDNMNKGVYTVTCSKCGQPIYVHADGEGGLDPMRCQSCKTGFLSVEKGEENDEYMSIIEEEATVPKEEPKNKKKYTKKGNKKESFKLEVEEEV